MRCLVRIEGVAPFVLSLEDNLSLESYKDIVEDYYATFFDRYTKPPDIVLIRCLKFGADRLLDFRRARVKRLDSKSKKDSQAHLSVYVKEYESEIANIDQAIVFYANNETKATTDELISRVSFPRLIRKLCDPLCDEYTNNVFWTTLTSFTTPSLVLEHITRRYDEQEGVLKAHEAKPVVDPQYATVKLGHLQRASHRAIVINTKRRIVDLLAAWLSTSPWQFDEAMVSMLSHWMEAHSTDAMLLCPAMSSLLRGVDRRALWERRRAIVSTLPRPAGAPPVSPGTFHEVTAPVFAEQLHLLSTAKIDAIMPEELLNRCYKDSSQVHKCPNLLAYMDFHEKVANFIVHLIVSETHLETRVAILRKVASAANELKRMCSWDVLLAVHAAMENPNVRRLTRTFDGVRQHCGAILEDLSTLMSKASAPRSFKNAMEECRRNNRPQVICILVYLEDIERVEAQAVTLGPHINFGRAIELYKYVDFLLSQQHKDWHVQRVESILSMIETWVKIPETQLEVLSNIAESGAVVH